MKESVHYLDDAILRHCKDSCGLESHPHKFELGEFLYIWWCPTAKCQHERAKRIREGATPILTEMVERRPETILSKYNIPEKYYHCTLELFKEHDKIKKEMIKYVKTQVKKSLFLTGNSGSGKTHIAIGVLIELIKQGNTNMYFQDIPELLLRLRKSYQTSGEDTFREYEIIYSMRNYNLLVLDDLGAEKSTEYAIQALQLIINGRLSDMKTTIITSNLSLTAINETMPRIASRLSEYEIKSFLTVPDYRKNR
jgi:DNA replication protein DnaC